MKNNNLFAVLRAAFPAELERTAIETADRTGAPPSAARPARADEPASGRAPHSSEGGPLY